MFMTIDAQGIQPHQAHELTKEIEKLIKDKYNETAEIRYTFSEDVRGGNVPASR